MKSAIFNVEEHEAIYGPIETIDCEKEELRKLVRHYREQDIMLLYRKYIVKQKLLALALLFLAVICCFLATEVVETYFISLVCTAIGVPMFITDTVIIH